jgi:Nucleotide-diphospho-sugar transferase
MIFCTLFNWTYLPQGLVLYRSLERACKGEFRLYVLSLDQFTTAVLRKLNLAHLSVIELADIADESLMAVRGSRSIGEFCWTCTAPLLRHLQARHDDGSVVIYVDADLKFFSDPSVVLSELGSGSILIHEHDFAPEYAHLAAAAGRFNVGLLAIRKDEQGQACLTRWREQCLEECAFDPAAGKCGDQKYLNEWPDLYPGLVISAHPGVGLAPWNVTQHRIESRAGQAMVDDRPMVFYHFHSLKVLRPRLGFNPVLMAAGGYDIADAVRRLVYDGYATELLREVRRVDQFRGTTGRARFLGEAPTLPAIYSTLRDRDLLFSFGRITVPTERNWQLIQLLYGIDTARPKA